ncbi:isochorismatase family protein [Mucilaginibacter paludis]|uniref:Isochorismatase hydrolase n=1 Tax=Mucilaginibacter paludis DSM 18603 TaxID=714943 RepID=H1YFI6_9SPHI|nr:isochorismatase family protein [Mucilaginibacter paludis]EHQ27294.1 isochorismatase hydrolase [Mucilaginibacter paludis DSM 18603]
MITALDKNTALVLIDLQNGIVQLPLAHPVSDVLANASKLVEAFRKAGLPIVIVNVNPAGAAWTKARKDSNPTAGAAFKEDWLDIAAEINTQPGDIFITKHTWSAFYETQIDEKLKEKGVTGIVLAGISTSIGVEGTARDASERGYNITFATDAMTDMFADAHHNSLKYILPRIGETGTTDKIIEVLG